MLKRLAHVALIIIAAVAAPSLIAHMVGTSGYSAPPPLRAMGDDGWRLTKDGWEQLSPRVLPLRPLSMSPHGQQVQGHAVVPCTRELPRLDVHPAALTLLLVVGAIMAFFLFPSGADQASLRRS
jgi:hypothetical protein